MKPIANPLDNRKSYYRYHVFVCTNYRKNGLQSCNNVDGVAEERRVYMKEAVAKLAKAAKADLGIRINTAGCLGRCLSGPLLVIYPDNVWYRVGSTEDMDEIIQSHLMAGVVVSRLRLPDEETAIINNSKIAPEVLPLTL